MGANEDLCCSGCAAWWPSVQEPCKVAPDIFFILVGNKKLSLHSKHNSLAVRGISQMFRCLYFISFFPAYPCPFMGGFFWLDFFFPPHRSTESLEASCKGILSDHVKLKLVLCMHFYILIIFKVLGA